MHEQLIKYGFSVVNGIAVMALTNVLFKWL